MGLLLSITWSGGGRSFNVDTDELAALHESVTGDAVLAGAVGTVFGESDLGEPRKVEASRLREAAAVIGRVGAAGLSAVMYSIVEGSPPSSASRVSGIRIGEDVYCLKGGVDRCVLECMRVSSDGSRVEVVSREDVRQLRELRTDNLGVLKIRKRSKPGRLLGVLRGVREVLDPLPGDEVVEVRFG